MIEIESTECGLTVNGHARYAAIGEDIVCAGVSTLVQTFIQSIENLTMDKIQYDISPGSADIKHGNLSEEGQLLKDSFLIGVQMIAEEYPYNVRIL